MTYQIHKDDLLKNESEYSDILKGLTLYSMFKFIVQRYSIRQNTHKHTQLVGKTKLKKEKS